MATQRPRYVKLFMTEGERGALHRVASRNGATVQGILRELIAAADRGDVVLDVARFDDGSRLQPPYETPSVIEQVERFKELANDLMTMPTSLVKH